MSFVLNKDEKNISVFGFEDITKLPVLFKNNNVFGINEMFITELIQNEGKLFDTEYGNFVYKKQKRSCGTLSREYVEDFPTIVVSWDNEKQKSKLYWVIYSEQIKNFGNEYFFKEVVTSLLF